jgi:hypothetical protein
MGDGARRAGDGVNAAAPESVRKTEYFVRANVERHGGHRPHH